jgi:hypothetical protein
MKSETNIENRRFAACAEGARLLSICVRAAGRASASESVSPAHLSAGGIFRDRFPSGSQKHDQNNLMRCEIFRGKVPPRRTQNQKHHLETWTRLRQQSYE